MDGDRLNHIRRFYDLLRELEQRTGRRSLSQCDGRMDWPERGVYFFFEPGETRSHSGDGDRIVRIGTHALKDGSQTSLWTRLSQHRGQRDGGGNHRGSIFRLIVGTALMARGGISSTTWSKGATASREIRHAETAHERAVSAVIGAMPFLWLDIGDEPGPASLRGLIERNSIALLSNHGREAIDPPSVRWLGRLCDRSRVRASGLWNNNHVEENYDPAFLDQFAQLIRDAGRAQ